jgi:hypothetical protein
LRVVRAAGGNTYRSIASTGEQIITDTIDKVRGPFPVSPGLQIQQGDLIGLRVLSTAGTVPAFSGPNTNQYKVFAPSGPFTDLADGGPAIAPQQNNVGQQIAIQATITFTTPPPPCPPNCPPPPVKPSLTRLSVSPKTFRAASRGGSVARARRRVIPTGTTVSYRLSQAATTTFTLTRATSGRLVARSKCVAPKRSNRTKPRCTRYVSVRGSFSRAGTAGTNRFKFTGRLRGRKLAPGTYRLTAVASNANGKSVAVTSSSFTIVR